MKKMVVCTFENTLIDDEESISMKTMLEIDRLRNSGYLFTTISENDLDYVLSYNRDFPFLDFIVFFDGAGIFDTKLNKVILKKKINYTTTKKIINISLDYDIYVYTAFQKIKINSIDDIVNHKKDILRIDIFGKNITTLYKKLIALDLDINITKTDHIKILSNCSRCFSVDTICMKKKIDISNCFVIGGCILDIETINKYRGNSINNAPLKLRRISNRVSVNNNSLRVCELLRELS